MKKDMEIKVNKMHDWLLCHYPLKNIITELYIRDALLFGDINESFICDNLDKNEKTLTICLLYNASIPLSPTDELTIDMYKVKRELLPFWYLYHEYGHVVALDERITKYGKEKVKSWLFEKEKEIESLKDSNERHINYKNLSVEKEADLFAKTVYMDTVNGRIPFF